MNNAKNSRTKMRFSRIREDELIQDRLDKLNDDLTKAGKHYRNLNHVQETELHIEVLNRRVNPEQIDDAFTFHGKKLGGWLRDACIAEALWLWCMRHDPYGNQQ